MSATIFVTGGTGIQGSRLIKALLYQDEKLMIHALVRDLESPASQRLVALGSSVKLFQGDFDDVSSIEAAVSGCTIGFLNVTPVHNDVSAEPHHACNLIAACAATPSLKRIIYSSSGALHIPSNSRAWTDNNPNKLDSFMTTYMVPKRACEEAVTAVSPTDLPDGWCILRATTFFTNFLPPFTKFMYKDLESKQIITTASNPGVKTAYLDPNDLAKFAARALLSNTDDWNNHFKNKIIPLGKQNLSLPQVIDSMNRALKSTGSEKQISIVLIPDEQAQQLAANGDLVVDANLHQNRYGVVLDEQEVRMYGADVDNMVTVDEFFEREREAVVVAVGGK